MHIKFFFNIKLSQEIKFFKFFPNFLSSKIPEIVGNKCKNINMIKHGSVWKTTSKSRNQKLINWVNQYLQHTKKRRTLLELGASSGISVFPGLKKKVKIKKYFLTDLHLNHYYKKAFSFTLLFSNKKDRIPFMAFNKMLIFYSDSKTINFIPSIISYLIRIILSIICLRFNKKTLFLLDDKIIECQIKYPIVFKKYNLFSTWRYSDIDLIIASNLLNNSYFSKKLMNSIVSNIFNMLKVNDIIIIGDNKKKDKKDKISVFKKTYNKFVLIQNKGGKVESHDFFLKFLLK